MSLVDKGDLEKVLLKTGALKFGVFTLTSGKLSPYYIDLRLLPSFPAVLTKIIEMYEQAIEKNVGFKAFDRLAGVPTAGIPFGSIIAYKNNKPFLYIRKETKVHGRGRRVEGILNPGDKILIADDLATTGKSTLSAVEAIQSEGGVVENIVVLVDREEGAAKSLEEKGIKLHAISSITLIAEKLYKVGSITEEQYHKILAQRTG